MTQHRGFTLVEVLVALAITAMALAAGLKAAGALTDNAQRLGDVTAAHWCADNALVDLRLAQQFPGTGESEFGCTQLGREFRGLLRTQTTPTMTRCTAMVMTTPISGPRQLRGSFLCMARMRASGGRSRSASRSCSGLEICVFNEVIRAA